MLRRACLGMHIEPFAIPECEGQIGQKLAFGGAKLAACPVHGDLGVVVHALAAVADRIVMIAEERDRALAHKLHDGPHRPIGIGAIADIIAEQHKAFRAEPARPRKARGECLPICVNIRNQCDQQRGAPPKVSAFRFTIAPARREILICVKFTEADAIHFS